MGGSDAAPHHKLELDIGSEIVSDAILVLNAGSSSIKFSLFAGHLQPTRQDLFCERICEGIGVISQPKTAQVWYLSTSIYRRAQPMRMRSRRFLAGSNANSRSTV
jgi:hypothetical protein